MTKLAHCKERDWWLYDTADLLFISLTLNRQFYDWLASPVSLFRLPAYEICDEVNMAGKSRRCIFYCTETLNKTFETLCYCY